MSRFAKGEAKIGFNGIYFQKKIENCKFINDITSFAKIQFPRITREMKYNDDKIP